MAGSAPQGSQSLDPLTISGMTKGVSGRVSNTQLSRKRMERVSCASGASTGRPRSRGRRPTFASPMVYMHDFPSNGKITIRSPVTPLWHVSHFPRSTTYIPLYKILAEQMIPAPYPIRLQSPRRCSSPRSTNSSCLPLSTSSQPVRQCQSPSSFVQNRRSTGTGKRRCVVLRSFDWDTISGLSS